MRLEAKQITVVFNAATVERGEAFFSSSTVSAPIPALPLVARLCWLLGGLGVGLSIRLLLLLGGFGRGLSCFVGLFLLSLSHRLRCLARTSEGKQEN